MYTSTKNHLFASWTYGKFLPPVVIFLRQTCWFYLKFTTSIIYPKYYNLLRINGNLRGKMSQLKYEMTKHISIWLIYFSYVKFWQLYVYVKVYIFSYINVSVLFSFIIPFIIYFLLRSCHLWIVHGDLLYI